MSRVPGVLHGRMGWANGDRKPIPVRPQLDAYGPKGRWGGRSGHDGKTTQGDHLADALVEFGAGEGDRLLVLVLPRETTDNQVDMLSTLILEQLPALEGTPDDEWLQEVLDR